MDRVQMVSAVLQAVQALPQDRQPLIVALVAAAPPARRRWQPCCSSRQGAAWCTWTTSFCGPSSAPASGWSSRAATSTMSGSSPRCWSRCGRARTVPTALRLQAAEAGRAGCGAAGQADCGGGLLQLPPDAPGSGTTCTSFLTDQSTGAAAPNRAAQRPAGAGDVPGSGGFRWRSDTSLPAGWRNAVSCV